MSTYFRKRFVISIAGSFVLLGIILNCISFLPNDETIETIAVQQWEPIIENIFIKRNNCLISGNTESLKSLYAPNEKNSKLAMETEVIRSKYLKNWSEKQGAKITSIKSLVNISYVKKVGRGYAFSLIVNTEYIYAYDNEPETKNVFRIGTYHSMDLIPGSDESVWVISREWYDDPFIDSLNLEKLKTDEIQSYITSQQRKDLSSLSKSRQKAIEYADRYCGAAAHSEYGFDYNSKYPNFRGGGGDCANFASQCLYESNAFRKTSSWNVDKKSATRAWCNAQGFKDYLLWSGRASLIARGSYNLVYKSAYKLLPGDIIAYEKKSEIEHISIVTSLDLKGYPLVNSHTTDRFHVPWDLGWSNSNIKFWLLRVHY